MLRIVVLGAAAGGGFPQWNCNLETSRRARAGDAAAESGQRGLIASDVLHELRPLLNPQ